MQKSYWLKTTLILLILFFASLFLPKEAIDPWQIFSPKKIVSMIFALALIQSLGSTLMQYLSSHTGAILTGFLGGLVSSTATTASLAKKSKTIVETEPASLAYLAATLAMLLEALAILLYGTDDMHWQLILIFLGPLLVTTLIILSLTRKDYEPSENTPAKFKILPILKLAAFIIAILALSKILQKLFGQSGLLALTFLFSLFEIHGAVIANVQMHSAGSIDVKLLGSLLTLSLAASYVSKLFLVFSLGSKTLKIIIAKYSLALFATLAISWLIFIFFVLNSA